MADFYHPYCAHPLINLKIRFVCNLLIVISVNLILSDDLHLNQSESNVWRSCGLILK